MEACTEKIEVVQGLSPVGPPMGGAQRRTHIVNIIQPSTTTPPLTLILTLNIYLIEHLIDCAVAPNKVPKKSRSINIYSQA